MKLETLDTLQDDDLRAIGGRVVFEFGKNPHQLVTLLSNECPRRQKCRMLSGALLGCRF